MIRTLDETIGDGLHGDDWNAARDESFQRAHRDGVTPVAVLVDDRSHANTSDYAPHYRPGWQFPDGSVMWVTLSAHATAALASAEAARQARRRDVRLHALCPECGDVYEHSMALRWHAYSAHGGPYPRGARRSRK